MIQSNDRIFVGGKTGSGKTTLVKKVLWNQYTDRVFHDPKLTNSDLRTNAALARDPETLENLLSHGKRSILYQPVDLGMEDFDMVCSILFRRGNIVLFCDEAAAVCNPSFITEEHRRLVTQGRARGLGVVSCSQRTRDCHSLLLSETEHFFIFRLQLETDVAKLKKMIPPRDSELIYKLPRYHFIYFNPAEFDNVIPFAPLTV